MKNHVTTTSIFDDLGFDSEEASSLKARAALMNELLKYIKDNKLTQKKAAKVLGVTQPRISDLKCGKIQLFTIDMLIKMINKIGQHIEFRINGITIAIA